MEPQRWFMKESLMNPGKNLIKNSLGMLEATSGGNGETTKKFLDESRPHQVINHSPKHANPIFPNKSNNS